METGSAAVSSRASVQVKSVCFWRPHVWQKSLMFHLPPLWARLPASLFLQPCFIRSPDFTLQFSFLLPQQPLDLFSTGSRHNEAKLPTIWRPPSLCPSLRQSLIFFIFYFFWFWWCLSDCRARELKRVLKSWSQSHQLRPCKPWTTLPLVFSRVLWTNVKQTVRASLSFLCSARWFWVWFYAVPALSWGLIHLMSSGLFVPSIMSLSVFTGFNFPRLTLWSYTPLFSMRFYSLGLFICLFIWQFDNLTWSNNITYCPAD